MEQTTFSIAAVQEVQDETVLTLQLLQDLAQNGFAVRRNPGSKFLHQVQQAFQLSQTILEKDKNIKKIWRSANGSPKHLVAPHLFYPVFQDLILADEVTSVVSSYFPQQRLYLFNGKISLKKPGEIHTWLPHQDSAYKTRNTSGLTVCIFLEDADDHHGTLQVFPGSHQHGRLEHQLPDLQGDYAYQLKVRILPDIPPVSVNAKAGDILFMSNHLIHQSQPNQGQGNRPIFIFEIEPFRHFAIDEYGKFPFVINSKMRCWEKAISLAIYQLSPPIILKNLKTITRKLLRVS